MNPEKNIDEILDRYITSASKEEVESHCDKVFEQLQWRAQHTAPRARQGRRPNSRRMGIMAAAAAVLFAVFVGVWWHSSASAVLEDIEGSRRVNFDEVVYSNDVAQGTLVLADGSRVEMRSKSELLLERAGDGVRIRLNKGGIIVSAAKQRNGHLYVQTSDVTVSVIGTVFLVNTEEEGSRVAVIEGEVRVQQQGTAEKKLLPGEQVKTNPSMESQPVSQEIAWSRHAETHLALLQQSTAALTEERVAFEEASVRPVIVDFGGRGGGPVTGCAGLPSQIDPRRFAVTANLYTLIAMAYSKGGCLHVSALDLLSGGPGWVRLRSDQFAIQALMPEGSPRYTPQQVRSGDAPKLQLMLRTLLEDRFKLVLRHELKEMPVYLLKTWKGTPKLTPSRDDDKVFSGTRVQADPDGQTYMKLEGGKASMTDLASSLTFATLRPVLDRTEIRGEFNFAVEYDSNGLVRPTIFDAIQGQLGLKLDDSKGPVDIWVIEHVEKPSEN